MKRFLVTGFTTAAICCLAASSVQASMVYLANTVTETGGAVNQAFTNTNTGSGFSGGNTIVSGVTTREAAIAYTAIAQGTVANPLNGRFNLSSFGTVNYNYSTPRDLHGLLFWNYNEWFSPSTYNERGANRADISIVHSGGTLVLDNVALTLTPDTDVMTVTAAAQQISFGAFLTGVTQIRLSDLQGPDTVFRGWQEVAAYQVPEPSSLSMLLFGAVVLWLMRRK